MRTGEGGDFADVIKGSPLTRLTIRCNDRSDVSAASAASAPVAPGLRKKRALTRTASQPTSTEVVAAVTTARDNC